MQKFPDLRGKVITITGKADGLGQELASMCAQSVADLSLHGPMTNQILREQSHIDVLITNTGF